MEAVKKLQLEVVKLGCRYGESWIFKDLSFSVRPGEAAAVVGPSGSGKTTLVYCLVGIIPNKIKAEVEGAVVADGRNVLGLSIRENAKLINVVLQEYEMQIFGLTVEEDLAFGLENLGLEEAEIRSRIKWALRTFDLERYRSYYVHELSSGLRQKLAIASAVVAAPRYLVLDDPTANLDWRGIVEVQKIIRKLKEEGRGVVVMTRRLKGLEQVIDKIIRLGRAHGRTCGNSARAQLHECRTATSGSDCAVVFDNVWFRYSREYVLEGVSLRIRRSECVALMGANGSGKTTLVKHVNGLLKPLKGRVAVLGADTRAKSPAQLARHVGFVFQDPDKHITCETVWDEATFGARNLGLDCRYAEEALKVLGLWEKKDQPPYLLSMGEKIRASIASALGMNPEILILDEPTTGQDEETLKAIALIIGQLKLQNKTILVITHDSDFALSVSDRVVVMNSGKIAADGPSREILLNASLVEKLGLEPPSNLLSPPEVVV